MSVFLDWSDSFFFFFFLLYMSQHRKVISVSAHMTVEVATLRETSVTYLALIRLLSSVCAKVLGEGGAISKALAAHAALVGAVSRVGAHVRRHRAALREATVTYWALEWLFTTVCPEVCSEVSGLCEALLANGALVWFFTRVRPKVGLQSWLTSVCLPAHVTGVVSRENLVSPRKELWEIAWSSANVWHGRSCWRIADGGVAARGRLGVRRRVGVRELEGCCLGVGHIKLLAGHPSRFCIHVGNCGETCYTRILLLWHLNRYGWVLWRFISVLVGSAWIGFVGDWDGWSSCRLWTHLLEFDRRENLAVRTRWSRFSSVNHRLFLKSNKCCCCRLIWKSDFSSWSGEKTLSNRWWSGEGKLRSAVERCVDWS